MLHREGRPSDVKETSGTQDSAILVRNCENSPYGCDETSCERTIRES